jgi:hypothetical protein
MINTNHPSLLAHSAYAVSILFRLIGTYYQTLQPSPLLHSAHISASIINQKAFKPGISQRAEEKEKLTHALKINRAPARTIKIWGWLSINKTIRPQTPLKNPAQKGEQLNSGFPLRMKISKQHLGHQHTQNKQILF